MSLLTHVHALTHFVHILCFLCACVRAGIHSLQRHDTVVEGASLFKSPRKSFYSGMYMYTHCGYFTKMINFRYQCASSCDHTPFQDPTPKGEHRETAQEWYCAESANFAEQRANPPWSPRRGRPCSPEGFITDVVTWSTGIVFGLKYTFESG